jgi:hypothetical protein
VRVVPYPCPSAFVVIELVDSPGDSHCPVPSYANGAVQVFVPEPAMTGRAVPVICSESESITG